MSVSPDGTDRPLRGVDDLLELFHRAEKPRDRWRVGAEAERFGVYRENGAPLPFVGDRGVQGIFRRLVESHGWLEQREFSHGEPIALTRGESSITLEPGAQVELSGAPATNIHAIDQEFEGYLRLLRAVAEDLALAWLPLGFHPFARREELPWAPKERYRIMREYLPTRGGHALDMMQRTATVQANLDYASEEDAMRKLRVAVRTQPIVTAMCANSPFAEGKANGDLTLRGRIWLDVDPDRSGLLPFMWDAPANYRSYVEWALRAPMFLIYREDRAVRNTGQPFRDFMQNGFEGHVATQADWELHLSTLFPEARLKNTLELRGADSLPASMACGVPALWKGLLYDDQALERVEALVEDLDYETVQNARGNIARLGVRALLDGRPVADWATELLEIATAGLERQRPSPSDPDEAMYLTPLARLVGAQRTPADELLARVSPAVPLHEQLDLLQD